MVWRVGKVEKQRKEFVEQVNFYRKTITDLCYEYQISRKTAYKWIRRYKEEGEKGLKDKSRRRHSYSK